MIKSFDLTGRVAVVTGANTGLGQAIALALAEAGAAVAAVGRSSMADTARLVEATDAPFLSISADLSTTTPIERIVAETLAWRGRLDILVNNAGIIRRAEAIAFTEADWDAVLADNLKSAFFLAQTAARQMLKQQGGKIINIASLLSFQGGIRVASYTASKSGLIGLTRLLACEWAPRGSTSMRSRPATSSPTIPRRCGPTPNVTNRFWRESPQPAGESQKTLAERRCSWRRRLPTTCMARSFPSTVAGLRVSEGKFRLSKITDIFVCVADLPWRTVAPGVKRKILVYDERVMLVRVAFDTGAVGTAHRHPHVQCSVVECGVFDVTIAGRTKRLRAGDSFIVPADTLHGVVAIEPGSFSTASRPHARIFSNEYEVNPGDRRRPKGSVN